MTAATPNTDCRTGVDQRYASDFQDLPSRFDPAAAGRWGAAYKYYFRGRRLVLKTPNAESPAGSFICYGDFTHEVRFASHCLSRLLHLCGFQRTGVREQGSVPWGYSLASSARYLVLRAIRLDLIVCNRVETGSAGPGVFTRVFVISGRKT